MPHGIGSVAPRSASPATARAKLLSVRPSRSASIATEAVAVRIVIGRLPLAALPVRVADGP